VKLFIILFLLSDLAYAEMSYNSLSKKEGDSATDVESTPTLVGKRSTDGALSYLKVDGTGGLVTTTVSGFGSDFAFGDITSTSLTIKTVARTTYTEQTTNAQRSIASANAADTAAGTGARTVQIEYYDQTGAGPFTETVTLNGTTYVNTVATNICFIQSITVLTVGSGGVNAGILTLKAATAGGGATIGTVNATDNRTFWAHQYVATGKEMNITGIAVSHSGTTVGSGGVFIVRATTISANSAALQVTDFIRLYGQASTFLRVYQSPIKVLGPAKVFLFVTPETATSTVYRGSIDFFIP
jgi:hypothetical protein